MPKPRLVSRIVGIPIRYARADADSPLVCPLCGEQPTGVEQTFVAPSSINIVEDDGGTTVAEYDGNGTDTEILWNNSEEIIIDGLPLLTCDNGDRFIHPRISRIKS